MQRNKYEGALRGGSKPSYSSDCISSPSITIAFLSGNFEIGVFGYIDLGKRNL